MDFLLPALKEKTSLTLLPGAAETRGALLDAFQSLRDGWLLHTKMRQRHPAGRQLEAAGDNGATGYVSPIEILRKTYQRTQICLDSVAF